ncbi:MAG: PEGA domain-containing protein [Gemmataceae bacterium]|nr:PEGA domain-containing protein [Gemmataceae bacterium]
MRRNTWVFLGAVMCAGWLSGCVERRYEITTEPPGAAVQVNGKALGAAPVDGFFTYYGNYHFTIVHDGYQTLQVDQCIPRPWYQYFPLDFFFENLWPWRIIDKHPFRYEMVPLQQPRTDALLSQAENLRNRARTIQPPPGHEAPPPAVPALAPPPGLPAAAPPPF